MRYSITASDNGPQAANQVTLRASGLPFDENSGITPIPSQGTCNTGVMTSGSADVSCTLGTLATGASATVAIRARR